ncbi:MAG TPA: protein kinase [Holophagaceae bacterium]|nr:protein kinase [Holophagaceae bacterium]
MGKSRRITGKADDGLIEAASPPRMRLSPLLHPLPRAALLAALAVGLAATAAPAAPVQREDPVRFARPALQVFTSREGLPQNSVMGLAFDAQGRLWVATQDGAAHYDGHAWGLESPPDRARSNFLRCVFAASDGGLWFGRQDGGVARLKAGRWDSFPLDPTAQRINAVAEEGGRIYAASEAGGLRVFDGSGWAPVEGLPSARIRCLESGAEGIWAGTATGLVRVAAGRVVATDPSLKGISALLETRSGLVAGTLDGTLQRRGPEGWSRLELPPGLQGRTLTCLAETEDGRGALALWVGSDGAGLWRRDAEGWRRLGAAEGLGSASLWSLQPQPRRGPTETLWIGTDAGLGRLAFGLWSSFGEAQGMTDASVYALALPEAPRLEGLWLGTRSGLWRIREGRAVPVPEAKEAVFSLLPWKDPEGERLYAGLRTRGLWDFDGLRWRQPPQPPALAGANIRRLQAGREGDLWAITGNHGVWRRRGTAWQGWTRAEGLPVDQTHSVLEASDGSLWIGTEAGGLARFRDGRVEVFDTRNSLPNNTVLCLAEGRWQGRAVVWAGTEGGGLLRTDLGPGVPAWTVLSDRSDPALPNNTVYQLQQDGGGRLYAFTNHGVARISERGGRAAVETFTTESGLPSQEFNGGASMVDGKGRIWAGGVGGAVVFDPAAEPPPGPLQSLVFTGIQVAGEPRALASGTRLGFRDRDLRFDFDLPQLLRGEETRYRTQLMGLEAAPHPWSAERYREFPGLRPGDYVFRVWARDFRGRIAGPLDLAFTLPPAPWRTPWAYGLYALALAGAIAAGVRLRLRALRRRTEELEAQVRARTAEIEAQKSQIEAQNQRIAGLMDSAALAQLDLLGWARGIAREVASALGVKDIGVFMVQGEELRPLSESGARRPSLHELRTTWLDPARDRRREARPVGEERRHEQILPVKGTAGDILGCLVVQGGFSLGSYERQLLGAFATQLGGVLELHRTRQTLQAAQARQALTRQALRDKGVALLQVCPACGRCYDESLKACLIEGARLESPRVLPHVLEGRYRLARLLGEGGMGLVFEARDLRLGREVALKLLKPELYANADLRARFQQEAKVLASLDHPGLIGIHDSGELEDGSAFLVMELLRGATLGSVLRRHGAGRPDQVADLLRQAAAGLAAAHRAGIMHRDIKPENLFLQPHDGGFRVKLLDFGLAKSLEAQTTGFTHTGMVVGTPQYMSPEQVNLRPMDARSDLYALAATGYEALSGRRLIRADQTMEVFSAITKGHHQPLGLLVPELPAAVETAFEAALEVDPEARPREVEAWVAGFAPLLEAMASKVPGWPSIPVEGFDGSPQPTGAEPTATKPKRA